jgi:methionyl-tRNA formyltransferase
MRIIFAGTPAFAAPCLQALIDAKHDVIAVYTQPDRPAGRGRKLTASPVKTLAMQHNISVYQPNTLRDPLAQQQLKSAAADLLIVVAYGLLLPVAVLQATRLGAINVHASLLPRWRGAAPIQYAILAGDKQSGVTIMQMDEGLDTGAMLAKITCPLDENDTGQTLHDKLAALGPTALLDVIQQLADKTVRPQAQDDTLTTYAPKITKQAACIDWHLAAEEIARQVRAFNPWPVAFTEIAGQLVRIYRAYPIPEQKSLAAGEIAAVTADGIVIACGQGWLVLTEIQLPGHKPLPVSEIIKAPRAWLAVGHRCQDK